ncbi:hypothetical protein AB1K54_15915 [Microbacterium sp. BWT-B31]|uniref:hypothetical protein n=1 Tax=Microbacterium sp. BWT-B31 TaxID=3232072 RepID=UPI003528ADE4
MSLDLRELPGALFGSGAALRHTLTTWDAGIRGAVPTARRIGFVSLTPGVGVSTLAAAVVRAIAARRSEPLLAVDVSTGALGLGDRLGFSPTAPNDDRWAARTTADATAGLAPGDGFLGLRPAASSGTVATWLDEAAPITRFFDVSITDFGARHPLIDLAECAALCDTVCVVSDARRSPAELARAVVPAIEGLPEAPTALLALVDHTRAGDAVARAFAADGRVVGIPFDRGLRAGRGPHRPAARRAVLQLASALVSGEVVA